MRVIICGVLLAAAATVYAEERLWVCTDGGGMFDDPLCWADEILPGSDDTIVFENPTSFPPTSNGPYTVQITETESANRLVVRSGLVTLDLRDDAFILLNNNPSTPSIVVGDTTTANAMLSVVARVFDGRNVTIGKGPGTLGLLDVTLDGLFGNFEATHSLTVGDEGIGLLSVQDTPAAEVSFIMVSTVVVGREAGSFGQLHITDIDAAAGMIGPWTIGGSGFGTVTVDNSIVDSTAMTLGLQAGGYGALTVAGVGSEFDVQGTLDVGVLGQGVVRVEQGALLRTELAATLGSINGTQPAYGNVTIAGPGSLWDADASVSIGGSGVGRLTLSAGGQASVNGDLNRGVASQNQIVFELDAADDYTEPAIAVTGATSDFDAVVRLVGGYEPAANDTFVLATAGSSLGVFTLNDLPALTPPLIWQVDQDGFTLTLTVIDPGRKKPLQLIPMQLIPNWNDFL